MHHPSQNIFKDQIPYLELLDGIFQLCPRSKNVSSVLLVYTYVLKCLFLSTRKYTWEARVEKPKVANYEFMSKPHSSETFYDCAIKTIFQCYKYRESLQFAVLNFADL